MKVKKELRPLYSITKATKTSQKEKKSLLITSLELCTGFRFTRFPHIVVEDLDFQILSGFPCI